MLPATTSNSPESALDPRDHLDHAARVPVRRVDDEHVGAGRDEGLCPLDRVGPDADRGADAQPALRVLGRLGNSIRFWMSLTVISPRRIPFVVDHRQLLDPMAVEQALGLAERRPDRRRHEPSAVISAETGSEMSFSKRRSRFVRIPTRRPPSSVIGTPETW